MSDGAGAAGRCSHCVPPAAAIAAKAAASAATPSAASTNETAHGGGLTWQEKKESHFGLTRELNWKPARK